MLDTLVQKITRHYRKKAYVRATQGQARFSSKRSVRNFPAEMPPPSYADILPQWYYAVTGKRLNLASPQTLNEKMQWLKLYDCIPLKTLLADKYLVKSYISERIGERYVARLFGAWDSFSEIDFSALPDQFALKVNHGFASNFLVTDKKTMDLQDARAKFKRWLDRDYAFVDGFEMQYSAIPPKIIAEEYLGEATDFIYYRFFCFNGKPEMLRLGKFVTKERAEYAFYDMEYTRLPQICSDRYLSKPHEKSANWSDLVRLANILCRDFLFVRVDFYEIKGKIYFSEMTFTPGSGCLKWSKPEYDLHYGKLLQLPID